MAKAKQQKQRRPRATQSSAVRRRSPAKPTRLDLATAGEIVQEALPGGPHGVSRTLEDAGLTTEAKRNAEEARVWFDGLRAVRDKIGIRGVFDGAA